MTNKGWYAIKTNQIFKNLYSLESFHRKKKQKRQLLHIECCCFLKIPWKSIINFQMFCDLYQQCLK